MSDDQVKQTTRREFLKGAAVVGTGVLTGAALPLTSTPTLAAPVPAAADWPPAMGHVERNVDVCAGCRTCEAVCALSHDGAVSPSLARTWITDYVVEGRRIEGITCRQCSVPECALACPANAIVADPKTGARVVDVTKCVGAGLCVKACPQYPNSPVRLNVSTKKAIKCDLCGGDPLCVKFCPEAAMTLVKTGKV
jgi:anaerobic carbon-monoxide dehydrogenase iron sulfur subunit